MSEPLIPADTSPTIKQLQLTLWIGAATNDATTEQFERLRERLRGELNKHRIEDNTNGLCQAVLEIMGADWEPSGSFREQLEALGWTP